MKNTFRLIIAVLLAALICVSCVTENEESVAENSAVSVAPSVSDEISEESEESIPEVNLQAMAVATIGSSGDILVHNGVRKSGYDASAGVFDYSYAFEYLAPYVKALDYAVVNAEFSVSADGTYASLPFRVPEAIVKALAQCGYDMGTTANNHISDGGWAGMKKTMQTLNANGMDFTGTRLKNEDARYLIKDINGIKVGFLNYSYGSYTNTNCFSTSNLEAFYTEAASLIEGMRAEGAELVYLYIHWGAEYSLSPNESQQAIAQKMCDLGVDVIIGGHPHKIQPVDLIHSEVSGKSTICLYSMGNLWSGQQIECMAGGTQANSPHCFQDPWHFAGCDYPDVADRTLDTHRLEHGTNCNDNGHTEDGVVFMTNICRYEDGTVAIASVDVLPVWCMGRGLVKASNPINSYHSEYYCIPLAKSVDWQAEFGLTNAEYTEACYSYERTMALLSDGINEVNTYLAEQYDILNQQFKEGLQK